MKKLDKLLLIVAVQLEGNCIALTLLSIRGVQPAKALKTLQNIESEYPDIDSSQNDNHNIEPDFVAAFMYHKGVALKNTGDKKMAIQYLNV